MPMFWPRRRTLARMIQEAQSKGLSLRREAFQESGRNIRYYKGVKEWFSRMNAYAAERGIRLLHYVNSSGMKEIIEGTSIAHEFKHIYACSFLYNVDGIAYWPAVAVNYTNKTQFIFKINKGVESVFDSTMVNRYIEEHNRPVPFSNMIYVGDGTMFAPNVVVATAAHPIDPTLRKGAYQFNLTVRIGENCWIGAGAVILPGVTIGDNTVIGAGSVVTKDIPANVVAVGNPCRVLREITEKDRLSAHPEWFAENDE